MSTFCALRKLVTFVRQSSARSYTKLVSVCYLLMAGATYITSADVLDVGHVIIDDF